MTIDIRENMRSFDQLRKSDRFSIAAGIARELKILGLTIDPRLLTLSSYVDLVRSAGSEVQKAFFEDEQVAVIQAMTGEKMHERAGEVLAQATLDLILSAGNLPVPRPSPLQSELTIEYGIRTVKLDALLDRMTRPYCADDCSKMPTGCCTSDFHSWLPLEMRNLQQIEAIIKGWKKRTGQECRYHSHEGCYIDVWKAPVCIGYLCNPLKGMLKSTYSGDIDKFCIALSDIEGLQRQDLYKEARSWLWVMDETIDIGNQILAEK